MEEHGESLDRQDEGGHENGGMEEGGGEEDHQYGDGDEDSKYCNESYCMTQEPPYFLPSLLMHMLRQCATLRCKYLWYAFFLILGVVIIDNVTLSFIFNLIS